VKIEYCGVYDITLLPRYYLDDQIMVVKMGGACDTNVGAHK